MMLILPDPDGVDPQALAERRRKRNHRRAAVWGAFLLLGLALGTIYATGFAETGGTEGSTATAEANSNEPSDNEDTSELAAKISQPTANLTFNWAGRWGSIDTAVLYELDLGAPFTASDKFFSEVLLTNAPVGFSDLQLEFRVAAAAGASCATSDLTGTAGSNKRVMIFDTDDAQVTFSGLLGVTTGLPGGAKYCIGVVDYGPNPESGKDTGGTFIRKSTAGATFPTPPNAYPEFVATLNRMQ